MLVAFLAVAVLAAMDIFSDLEEGTTFSHVLSETGALLVGLTGSVFIARQLVLTLRRARAVEREAVDLKEELAATQAECRSSKRCPSRDVSRDDREGDQANRTRTLRCVADGSTCASRFAASTLAPRSARSSRPTSCGTQTFVSELTPRLQARPGGCQQGIQQVKHGVG